MASYTVAVVVNAVRVVIAMWMAAHPFAVPTPGPAEIHRLEGIAVSFCGLVLLHELVMAGGRASQARAVGRASQARAVGRASQARRAMR